LRSKHPTCFSGPMQDPLPVRMAPRTLDEFVGQDHLMGPGRLLRKNLEKDRIRSLILYGPPGTGKTAFGQLAALQTSAAFERLNAVTSGVADLRAVTKRAQTRKVRGQRTILFLDEIHRYNRTQQDALLPEVESGLLILIGATTQNPFVTLQRALLSRSLVVEFHPLSAKDLGQVLDNCLRDQERGLPLEVALDPEARQSLISMADGDGRRLLSLLESASDLAAGKASPSDTVSISASHIVEAAQRPLIPHDRQGDEHYNVISAFIKSVRGSHPDAALYWLARLLEGGEDPRFIARRLMILASEDIGNADPRGLQVAVAAAQALDLVGLPEAALNLAQAAVYLALAPKSNASAMGIWQAQADVRSGNIRPVPRALRDSHFSGHEKLGHGKDYRYDHEAPQHFSGQDFGVPRGTYLKLSDMGYEKKLKDWMESLLKGQGKT